MENIESSISFKEFKNQILKDYELAFLSRECSILGKREVYEGRAKFGIFGSGKELPQIAMAKIFREGDFRSGYYRDQTLALAIEAINVQKFFAQLYANTDINEEPCSGGRQMGSHYATPFLDDQYNWLDLTQRKNIVSDISPTAGQMPHAVGLALASKLYKELPLLKEKTTFSNHNEIIFITIGDGSIAEGVFWESINTIGALKLPAIISIWDDNYGISVLSETERTKKNIAELLQGYALNQKGEGYKIISVKGWDYPALVQAYEEAEHFTRNQSIPVIIHVSELTQPDGHSSSGSHKRYKEEERIKWEEEYDCIKKFKEWILSFSIEGVRLTNINELTKIENDIRELVKSEMKQARLDYSNPIEKIKQEAITIIEKIIEQSSYSEEIRIIKESPNNDREILKKNIFSAVRKILRIIRTENFPAKEELIDWFKINYQNEKENYDSHLYSSSKFSALKIPYIAPIFSDNPEIVDGRVVIRNNFEKLFEKYPELITFGEDVGYMGDVNQGMEGMQKKFGKLRVADTGIREATIVGQAIGLAVRGLRPIAEIQYLDYIYYGLQPLADDLANLHYRTKGRQKAPAIIRTRGHRLEGVWHSGSPMGSLIHSLRGIFILVPRNFVKAAGFYNTMLQSDDPCIIIECLNAYRLKEKIPLNLGEFTTPIGEIEITKEGKDLTVVTYGSTWRIVDEAAKELMNLGIDIEIIDIQSLLPFDIRHDIVNSIKKTNRLVIIDEDVPGGASSYIMQKIVEDQQAFRYLDSAPITITATEHRPSYATDGDYFSKPSIDDIIEGIYSVMNEVNPSKYPSL